jgi:c-di-GMP-related signal transduction protein
VDIFVARQPVLDRRSRVVGYELLYRSGLANAYDGADPTRATASVLAGSLLGIGIERLVGNGQAYVNFARDALLGGYALTISPKRLVVEVLEDVRADAEVRAACEHLKAAGYTIALDDFVPGGRTEPLLDLADIIKVDFRQLDRADRARVAGRRPSAFARLLAEKVETADEHAEALALGFNLFQGYAFSRPETLSARGASAAQGPRIELMRVLQAEDFDLGRVEDLLKRDPALALAVLRYVNSAAFGLRGRIGTLRQALAYLGQRRIRAWIMVILLADMGRGAPFELVVSSVVRGRFCELVGELAGLSHRGPDLFLLGLFSRLDAITGRPLAEVVGDLPLAADVIDALAGPSASPLALVLDLARAYEDGRWDEAAGLAGAIGVPALALPERFMDAVDWGNLSAHIG